MKQKLMKKNNKYYSNVLVFVFLLLLPAQLGRHFFSPFSYLSGVRIDYLAPTVYLTDILALLLIICNYKGVLVFIKNKKILIIFALLFFNVVFSLSPFVSLYQYVKILEFLAVFAVFSYEKRDHDMLLCAFLIGGFFELTLSLLQFADKHSIQGLFYFFGERYFALSTPGIAKATISGTEFLRPYGTFSHPNSMAGFYLLVYFFTLTNKKIKKLMLKHLLLLISSALVFISFSKVAIITLVVLSSAFYFQTANKKCRLCFISKIVVLIAVGLVFVSARGDPLSLEKRIGLINNSLKIVFKYPLGVGLGSYLVAQNQFSIKYPYFFLQPVHNVFLLFLTETGIIITSIVLWAIIKWLATNIKNNASLLLVVLLFFITGLLDHYWLTLQQNFLLLAVVFGLANNPIFSPHYKGARLSEYWPARED